MTHFAFVAPPKQGHVYPTLPLVEELVARGHQVTYVTAGELLSTVSTRGVYPVRMPGEDMLHPDQSGNGSFEFTVDSFAGMLLTMIGQAELAFPAVLAQLRADPPDVVCYDTLGPLGAWLAEKFAVPGVALIPTMADNEHFSMATRMPAGGGSGRPPAELFGEVGAATARARHALGLGGPVRPVPMMGGRADLNLVFIPREFQIAGETFDDSFRFLGPSTGSRARGVGWQPPADGSPVLYISLGTVFNNRPDFFERCVEAFGDSDWRVVMVVRDSVALPKVPANFEVGPFLPQLEVLAHASVCLCHTGMNSTMESLYYGVPLVSVPQMPEQAVNGARVEELGLGVTLDDAGVTADLLRKVVDEVANDPTIRANVTAFGARLRAVDGAATGADALEQLLVAPVDQRERA